MGEYIVSRATSLAIEHAHALKNGWGCTCSGRLARSAPNVGVPAKSKFVAIGLSLMRNRKMLLVILLMLPFAICINAQGML